MLYRFFVNNTVICLNESSGQFEFVTPSYTSFTYNKFVQLNKSIEKHGGRVNDMLLNETNNYVAIVYSTNDVFSVVRYYISDSSFDPHVIYTSKNATYVDLLYYTTCKVGLFIKTNNDIDARFVQITCKDSLLKYPVDHDLYLDTSMIAQKGVNSYTAVYTSFYNDNSSDFFIGFINTSTDKAVIYTPCKGSYEVLTNVKDTLTSTKYVPYGTSHLKNLNELLDRFSFNRGERVWIRHYDGLQEHIVSIDAKTMKSFGNVIVCDYTSTSVLLHDDENVWVYTDNKFTCVKDKTKVFGYTIDARRNDNLSVTPVENNMKYKVVTLTGIFDKFNDTTFNVKLVNNVDNTIELRSDVFNITLQNSDIASFIRGRDSDVFKMKHVVNDLFIIFQS